MNSSLSSFFKSTPVIPVLVVDDIETAVPLAESLCNGGLSVIEITLRTPVALGAVSAIRKEIPECLVGVGTVLTPQHIEYAIDAGAGFMVSPGSHPDIIDSALKKKIPFLPGAVTPSEVMNLYSKGFKYQKFFPAKNFGGVTALKNYLSPFADVQFCPTGGISAVNFTDYLALDNVICVGGSWVAPSDLVKDKDWAAITNLAKTTVARATETGWSPS